MERLMSDLCEILIAIPMLFIVGTVILMLITMCVDVLTDINIISEFIRPYLRGILLGE